MKYLFCIFVLILVIGCSRQHAKSGAVSINTIESVKSRQIIYEGQPWVEVVLSQRVDLKAPAYVVGLRESKNANRVRWVLFEQIIDSDRVISRFRFKPVGHTNDITLNRDDFEWYPQVSGFAPVRVVVKDDDPGGEPSSGPSAPWHVQFGDIDNVNEK